MTNRRRVGQAGKQLVEGPREAAAKPEEGRGSPFEPHESSCSRVEFLAVTDGQSCVATWGAALRCNHPVEERPQAWPLVPVGNVKGDGRYDKRPENGTVSSFVDTGAQHGPGPWQDDGESGSESAARFWESQTHPESRAARRIGNPRGDPRQRNML